LALALTRRFRDILASLIGLTWPASRNRTTENNSTLFTGAMQCKV
jgi:hypothetical protein